MDMEYTGFLFLSFFVLITLIASFRWCCRRMRIYEEMMRGIEEDQERRRRVAEDMWIFSVQHGQTPHIIQGGTQGPSSTPYGNTTDSEKPMDDLPSYEDAIKMAQIPPRDTTQHL